MNTKRYLLMSALGQPSDAGYGPSNYTVWTDDEDLGDLIEFARNHVAAGRDWMIIDRNQTHVVYSKK